MSTQQAWKATGSAPKRNVHALVSAVLASATVVAAQTEVDIVETFSAGAMPTYLVPYMSDWEVEGGELRTVGPVLEAGWYIRSKYTYQIRHIGLRLRKHNEDGVVFLRSSGWRLLLRRKELMLKFRGDRWWYACAREIDFPADEWHEVGVTFDLAKKSVRLAWDGKALREWTGPLSEYRNTGYDEFLKGIRLPVGGYRDTVVLHAWNTGCAVSDLRLKGKQTGVAQGFGRRAYSPGKIIYDDEFERLAPTAPVSVKPVVSESEEIAIVKARHSWGGHRLATNRAFQKRFRVEEEGDYTLKLEIVSLYSLAQIMEVRLNGQVVSRDVYRALGGRSCPGERIKDYVPLHLEPGDYGLEIVLDDSLIRKVRRRWFVESPSIVLGRIELSRGTEEPLYVLSPRRPQREEASRESHTDYELFGKALHFRIQDLEAGDYEVDLEFYEAVLDHPGRRLMDVYVGKTRVAENLDVVTEAGAAQTLLTKSFPVSVTDGSLRLGIIGKKFQAFVNAIRLKKDGAVVFSHNAGWTRAGIGYPTAGFVPWNRGEDFRYGLLDDPLEPTKEPYYFEGHNLLANPSFSFGEDNGKPVGWRSIPELKATDAFGGRLNGTGEYSLDRESFHSRPSALRIGRTNGAFGLTGTFSKANYTKRQRFSAWVTTKGATGDVRLEMYWFATDKCRQVLRQPMFPLLGVSRSEPVPRDTPWRQVAVEAKPPSGANVVAKVIRVEDNNGTVWVDDVCYDGYGAEPVEVSHSHLGCDPAGEKAVLVKSVTEAPVRLEVLDKGGTCVLRTEGTYLGRFRFPDRHYYRCDLAKLATPGIYALRATQDGRTVVSQSFPVEKGIYRTLTGKLLHTLYTKRLNFDVPGVHEADWLDDAHVVVPNPRFAKQVRAGKRVNLLGGYSDAAGQMKCYGYMTGPIFGALNAALLLKPLHRDAWDELEWGLKGLMRAQRGDGSFWSHLSPSGHMHRDGIPYFGVERYVQTVIAVPHASGLFAMAAYYLRERNAKLAAACQNAAVKNYEYVTTRWNARVGRKKGLDGKPVVNGWDRLRFAPKALWGAMYLWKLTGEQRYRGEMEAHLDSVLLGLREKAYLTRQFSSAECLDWRNNVLAFDFIWVPVWLLRELPDHARRSEIKQGIYTFADEIQRISSFSPYGQAHALAPKEYGKPPRYPVFTRMQRYWTMLAYALAISGQHFRDRELVALAERQMQWLLGKNHHDVCDISGIGERFQMHANNRNLNPEYFNSFLKGGRRLINGEVAVGTGGMSSVPWPGSGKITYGRRLFGYLHGRPAGYLYRVWVGTPYATDASGAEFYLPFHGNALIAAAGLASALADLEP